MQRIGAEAVLRRNLIVFPITEVGRALLFLVPVWVAYELRYISLAELTVIEAIIQGAQMLLELPTGALADLVGKRWTIAAGNTIVAVSLVMYGMARSFPAFVAYAIVMGIGEALISGAKEALLYDTLKGAGKEHSFSKYMATYSLVFQVSLALATLLGGMVAGQTLLMPIWLTAAATIGAAVSSFWFLEPLVDTEVFTLRTYVRQTKQGVLELLKTPYSRLVSAYYIAVGLVTWVCVMIFNATLLTELGFTPSEFGVTMAAVRVFNTFILFKVVDMTHIATRKRIFLAFPVVLIVSLLPGVLLTKWWAVLSVLGVMAASTGRWVILGKYTNEVFESKNRATAISALSMAIGILFVAISLASGPFMERFGGVGAMYTALGIVSAFVVLPMGLVLARDHAHAAA